MVVCSGASWKRGASELAERQKSGSSRGVYLLHYVVGVARAVVASTLTFSSRFHFGYSTSRAIFVNE